MADIITRPRGDNYPDIFNITISDKSVTDITGYQFVMGISTIKSPVNNADLAHTIIGVITDPVQFQVVFTPIGAQTMLPTGTYYYEVEVTDLAGTTRTIEAGQYKYTGTILNSETA